MTPEQDFPRGLGCHPKEQKAFGGTEGDAICDSTWVTVALINTGWMAWICVVTTPLQKVGLKGGGEEGEKGQYFVGLSISTIKAFNW